MNLARATTPLLLAAMTLTACVQTIEPVNKDSSRAGVPLRPNQPTTRVPAGPVATAVPATTTRVASALLQVGEVPYDGVTLPLTSPTGDWLFTQTGSLPPWPSLLAQPDATPVPGNQIAAFRRTAGPLTEQPWRPTSDLETTAGLLLGRTVGEGWTLVERPNDDGSRWIGRLDFAANSFRWLVQGDAVNAQALLLDDGTLIYTTRPKDQPTSQLVIAPAAGPARTFTLDNHYLCQPFLTPDQSMVALVAIGQSTAAMIALSTTATDAAGAPQVIARQPLSTNSAATAFQSLASVEPTPASSNPTARAGPASPLETTLLYIDADRRRLALWDPLRNTTTLLPAGAASAARVTGPTATGLAVAAEKGLDFWPGSGIPARLVAGPFIPRTIHPTDTLTDHPPQSALLLLSPLQTSPTPALRVIECRLVKPNQ